MAPLLRAYLIGGVLCAAVVVAGTRGRAQQPDVPEYAGKAGFLYNFARFVTWPTNAFATADSPFVFGVLGQDPFGAELDRRVGGKTVDGRKIVTVRFARVEDVAVCHVLFISRSESNRLGEILSRLTGRSILTVGETERFLDVGGMINYTTGLQPVRFQVNLVPAERVQLQVSSKLLRLATAVRPEAGGASR